MSAFGHSATSLKSRSRVAERKTIEVAVAEGVAVELLTGTVRRCPQASEKCEQLCAFLPLMLGIVYPCPSEAVKFLGTGLGTERDFGHARKTYCAESCDSEAG